VVDEAEEEEVDSEPQGIDLMVEVVGIEEVVGVEETLGDQEEEDSVEDEEGVVVVDHMEGDLVDVEIEEVADLIEVVEEDLVGEIEMDIVVEMVIKEDPVEDHIQTTEVEVLLVKEVEATIKVFLTTATRIHT